jgi:hypothetical protein
MMSLKASCHCGAVTLDVPELPTDVAACNCSLCRRTGWLGAYYPDDAVRVAGETVPYIWGDCMIGIHHCPTCGCLTHWKTLGEDFGKMGINARLLEDFAISAAGGVTIGGQAVPVREVDGASY